MKIFLAPHNDDEALFGAFTIIRENPLVVIVTDGVIHEKRGWVTAADRRKESEAACKILGAKVEFMGLSDEKFTEADFKKSLKADFAHLLMADRVYAPAIWGNGNPQHNMVGNVAGAVWGDKVIYYDTYRKDDLKPQGNVIIFPSKDEVEKKCDALFKYESQIKYNRIHFDAIVGHPEYYVA